LSQRTVSCSRDCLVRPNALQSRLGEAHQSSVAIYYPSGPKFGHAASTMPLWAPHSRWGTRGRRSSRSRYLETTMRAVLQPSARVEQHELLGG